MATKSNEPDVYIKNEGYADLHFCTDKGKLVAFQLGIPNSLAEFGDEFCGSPVWNEKTKKGQYTCGIRISGLKRVYKKLEKAGLVIESEFGYRDL